MKDDIIVTKINEAEKRVKELFDDGDLKRISEQQKYTLSAFYQKKSKNRLKTAQLIFDESKKGTSYNDFSEVVSAAYYAMYYIVHSFLASQYRVQLKEGVRGVHAITLHLIVHYLIKTNKLAKHLYEEYCKTLDATAEVQAFDPSGYQKEAFEYAHNYQEQRTKREQFTYFSSENAEERHAANAINIANEFISTIQQLMKR